MQSACKKVLATFPSLAGTVCALLILPASLKANIINGDFENGLTGWTVVFGTWGTPEITPGDRVAACTEDCYMYQVFQLPAGAQSLTFKYRFFESGPPDPPQPDALNISLLDPIALTNLIPPPPGFEGFSTFLGEDVYGIYAVNPAYVTVSPIMPDNLRHVSVDVSFLPPLQDVRFQLFQFGFPNGRTATVVLDDVEVLVPEPAMLALLGLGLGLVARRSVRRGGGAAAFPGEGSPPAE